MRSSLRYPKDSHLGWGAENGVFLTDRQKRNRVVVRSSNPIRPRLEFCAGPFKAMVFVAQGSCRHGLKLHVVFAVGRGHHHCSGPRKFEENTLKCRKARRVEMLNY